MDKLLRPGAGDQRGQSPWLCSGNSRQSLLTFKEREKKRADEATDKYRLGFQRLQGTRAAGVARRASGPDG